jgi:hypothetical protein
VARNRDPACKTAVNWVMKRIRQMTRKRALERWETKIGNSGVTPQAIRLTAKFLLKRDGSKAPTAIHGPSGLKFLQSVKANAIAWRFSSHPMNCVTKTMNCGWRIEFMLYSKPQTTDPSEDKTM